MTKYIQYDPIGDGSISVVRCSPNLNPPSPSKTITQIAVDDSVITHGKKLDLTQNPPVLIDIPQPTIDEQIAALQQQITDLQALKAAQF